MNLMFWKEQPPRTTVLQALLFACLVISIVFTVISLNVFSSKYNEFREDAKHLDNDYYCILFISKDSKEGYSKNQNCLAVVWGQALVCVLTGALLIFLVLQMLFQFRKWYIVLVFLVISVLTLLFALTISIVLSSGFKQTCDTLENIGYDSCSDVQLENNDEYFTIKFYSALQGSTVCAWIGTLSLLTVVVVSVAGVFTVASLNVFASKNNEFREDAILVNDDYYCFLFCSTDRKQLYSNKQNCIAVITVQAVISILIGVLLTFLVIQILLLRKWYAQAVFLVVAILTLLLAFAISIVISAGFKKTCDTIKDSGFDSCSNGNLFIKHEIPISFIEFYSELQGSMACAWIETLILLPVVIASIIIICFGTSTFQKLVPRTGYEKMNN